MKLLVARSLWCQALSTEDTSGGLKSDGFNTPSLLAEPQLVVQLHNLSSVEMKLFK